MREFAPAKVNLYLSVLGRRDDGYHLLDSLVVFAGVGDFIEASPGPRASLSTRGPRAGELGETDDNLVQRAARALGVAYELPAARLMLEKHLPVAAGIGGGSADAAATLRVLARLHGLDHDLHDIAAALGADVPVCLRRKPARMTGIGDILLPAPGLPPFGLLLVNPGVAVSTKTVFNARSGAFSSAEILPSAWPDVDCMARDLGRLRNDLQDVACRLAPGIGDLLDVIAAIPDCRLARMSGSGATCFGLFDTATAAEAAAVALKRSGWWCWGGAPDAGTFLPPS